eukprot:gb/GECH01007713.1/.p1 GENE.gb/GECH01007713.1/~~gb/GECH01007713.1/.p1  ORF type:complete len:468 (+),score=110.58 gb/GECH01007713.1/:1-1404(+)
MNFKFEQKYDTKNNTSTQKTLLFQGIICNRRHLGRVAFIDLVVNNQEESYLEHNSNYFTSNRDETDIVTHVIDNDDVVKLKKQLLEPNNTQQYIVELVFEKHNFQHDSSDLYIDDINHIDFSSNSPWLPFPTRRKVLHLGDCIQVEVIPHFEQEKKDNVENNNPQHFPQCITNKYHPMSVLRWRIVTQFQGRGFLPLSPEVKQTLEITKSIDKKDHHVPLCTKWVLDKCPHSDNTEECQRRHFFVNEQEKAKAERMIKRQTRHKDDEAARSAQFHQDDPHGDKQPKACRARQFADFLVNTYGLSYLQSGSGVLDVAGGKGIVSFELLYRYGIPSTVIDPREAKLKRKQVRKLRKAELKPPAVFREMFNDEFVHNHHDLVSNASLIIGMHPDEAAEPIVDTALKIGKPFAVVPCCVFPRMFPDRRLRNGDAVVDINEFVSYLREKETEDEIKLAHLPIEGKNKVVYKK